MHFYQHHIGDFNNATRHLSIIERAIYRDLLDMYYEQESAIDASDLTKLQRRLLIRSTDEKQALEFVLDEFFEKQDDFYFNNRCESEIKKYQDKLETAIKAGKASAESRRKKASKKLRKDVGNKGVEDESNERSTDVEQTFNEDTQNVEPTNNHEPLTNNHKPNINNNNSASDFSVIDSIADWIHPELTEINAMLMKGAPPVPTISQADYDHQLVKFKNYYAEKEIEGSYVRLEGRRKDILTEWIKRDYIRQQKIKAQSQPARFNIDNEDWSGTTHQPPADDSYHPSHNKPKSQAKRDPSISVVVNGLWKEPLPGMSVQQTYDYIAQCQTPGEMQDEAYDRLLNQMQEAV